MTVAAVKIRRAQPDDIAPLAQSLGWHISAIEQRWIEVQHGEREMYVAEWDGRPVGSVSINVHDDLADMLHLFGLDVAPRFQRRGIGTSLIQHVEGEAMRRGASGVWLDVGVTNDEARRLYERLGYRRKGPLRESRWVGKLPDGETGEIVDTVQRMVKRFQELG